MPRAAATSSVFHAIADPTRRAVLSLLRDGDRSVNDIRAVAGKSQSALSQHLAVLRRAGLVEQHKKGRQRIYRVSVAPLREVADWIALYDRFWTQKLDHLGQYLDRQKAARESQEPRP
jgi:DNA-binding transcriptional ArsR family regulator